MNFTPLNPDTILESISGGFFALDKDFCFTYWNKAAEEGTGLSKDEVIGKNVFQIFPNAEKTELGEKYKRAMESKVFQSHVGQYKDAHFERWFDFRIYPNENGLSVFLQDITEQQRQDRQRETLLEISHVINTATQLDDLCSSIVRTLSQRYQLRQQNVLLYFHRPQDNRLILLAPELPMNEMYKDLYAIDLAEQNMLASVEAFSKGSPVVTENMSRSALINFNPEQRGKEAVSTLLALPLQVGHEQLGVLEILLNTDKGQAEREGSFLELVAREVAVGISRRGLIDELRVKNVDLEMQRSQTQEAHDKLRRFLAFFSHELRAPLNSIIGFSDLINEDITGISGDKLKEYNTAIKSSGSHLLHLINDILDLSKIESGKMELHYAPLSVTQLFDAIRQIAQPGLDERKITLETTIAEELDDVVADGIRLKQILLNLVTNAVKFSKPEGRVILSAKRNQTDIEFTIQDFGIGIKKEEISTLFQPFQQTMEGAKKAEGTGLGLAITKRLVELHGGSLHVVSEFGEGSSFVARIPIMVQVEQEAETIVKRVAAAAGSSGKKRVLIVEDKPHARTLLHTYLKEAGYVTEVAANGVEALEKAKLWKPDVITLDILLPVKDGWQVLRELKEHPLCREIPVIIISMVDERTVGFGLGAVEYFVKPVQKNELLEAIKKVDSVHVQKSAKILVIDDDQSVTELIQVILEAEGCTVLKTHTGKEGLETAEKEKPDLIILDLVMPELSGFDVAYQLKHNPATYTIPVMIMTSMEIDDETREQLQGFVVSLMQKSGFTKRDLLNEIASIEGKKS